METIRVKLRQQLWRNVSHQSGPFILKNETFDYNDFFFKTKKNNALFRFSSNGALVIFFSSWKWTNALRNLLRYENWVLKSRPCFSAHKSPFSRSHSKNRTFSSLSFLIYVSQEGYSMLGTSYLPIRVLLTRPAKKSVFVLKLNCCQNITKTYIWIFVSRINA